VGVWDSRRNEPREGGPRTSVERGMEVSETRLDVHVMDDQGGAWTSRLGRRSATDVAISLRT